MGYAYIPGTPNYNAAVISPREALTIGLDYYTLTTAVNILPAAVGAFADVVGATPLAPSVADFHANAAYFVAGTIPNDFSQDALNRLVEIIAQRGQPVIMGMPSGPVANAYSFKFAIEHPTSWGIAATGSPQAVPMLLAAIQTGGKDFGFDLDSSLAVTVTNSF